MQAYQDLCLSQMGITRYVYQSDPWTLYLSAPKAGTLEDELLQSIKKYLNLIGGNSVVKTDSGEYEVDHTFPSLDAVIKTPLLKKKIFHELSTLTHGKLRFT